MPLPRCPVLTGGHFLAAALVLGQDGESVRHADIVTDHPQELQGVRVLPELQPCFKIYRVDDEVTMDMVSITVGGDENFRTGPGTGSEFQGHLVSLLGSDILRGFEGLHILIEVNAIHLSVSCLGRFKLQNRIHPIAVDAADKPLARLFVPGFIFPHTVPHDTTHGTDVLPGFLDVGYGCHDAPRLIL